MRTMTLKTWRDIKARRGQFAGLIVLVTLGVAVYVAFVGAALDLRASADQANESFALADFETKVVDAPASVVAELAELDGVAAVQGRLIVDTGLTVGRDEVAMRAIGMPAGEHPVVNDVRVLDGSYLDPRDPTGILLQNAFADERGIGVGDRLTVRTEGPAVTLTVRGIVASAEYFFLRRTKDELPNPAEFAVVFAPQESVELVGGRPGRMNSFAVLVEDGADRAAVMAGAEKVLAPYYVLSSTAQEDQPSNFGMREEIRQNENMARIVPLMILAVSAMALAIAMARLVQSQRGEIGLSKALGYTDRQILTQYLGFTLIVGAVGSLLGIGLGLLMAYGIGESYRVLLNLPFHETSVHWGIAGSAVAISVVVCVLAGLGPALRSARLRPAQAMHSDPSLGQIRGHVPLVERALGRALPRSIVVRLPLRNVFRTRRRSLYTILGTVFALILIVSTWAMNDSIRYLIDRQVEEIETWDAVVAYEENVPASAAEEVAGLAGVTSAEAALVVPVRLKAGEETREVALTAAAPGMSFHGFTVVAGAPAEETLRRGGLIFPAGLAERLGVGVGDAVEVRSPYREDALRLEITTLSDEGFGAPIYVGEVTGRALAPAPQPVMNAVYIRYDTADLNALERALYAQPGVASVTIKESLFGVLDSLLAFMRFFVGVLFAFAFAVAFVVVYNTFTTNVIERTREIATMHTIGEDRRHVVAMITAENLMLAVVSLPLGLWLGRLAAGLIFSEMSTEAYTLPVYIRPTSYVWIVLSVLAILLLSEVPSLRRVFRLDLAAATKVME
jgi:putative ABC transport system permease protein